MLTKPDWSDFWSEWKRSKEKCVGDDLDKFIYENKERYLETAGSKKKWRFFLLFYRWAKFAWEWQNR